jgi:hypothetical protein|tara:strand:- start:124 stop:297 length:174 start_codon:yes stop_codon:yes gene_type:complete
MIWYYYPMSDRNKMFDTDTENPNDYREETVDELAEYKQYEEDMQSQIKTDLEEVQST